MELARSVTRSAFRVAAIEACIRKWEDGATPFVWVKTADEILAKAIRKHQDDSGAG